MNAQHAKVKLNLNMKWKYDNQEEGTETNTSQYINAGASGGGSVTKTVENNIYFYGDILESNALELNASLYELDKKLSVTKVFLDMTFPITDETFFT